MGARLELAAIEDLRAALSPSPATPGVSLQASDRYSTPAWLVRLIERVLRGVDCDPFYDPTSFVRARWTIDAREGFDAYVDDWPGESALVNGAYSGRFPQHTAARCREMFLRGHRIVNVCPAAVGSEYWKRDVWPYATAVAFLGRLAFPAGVDVYSDDGRLVCPAGVARGGNRTEIAAVYQGPDALVFERLLEPHAAVIRM